MPLLKKGVLIPSAGLDYSKPATFINDRNGFPQNMRYWRSDMRKICGQSKYGSVAMTGQVMGLDKLELNSGEKFLIRSSKTQMQRYNTTTKAWDSISANLFSGDDDDFFDLANVIDHAFCAITNNANIIRKYTGSGNVSALGGSPSNCKYLAYLAPYLVQGNIDNVAGGSCMLKWCDTDSPEVWSGGNSGSCLTPNDPSPIQRILNLNNDIAVYKQDSLWLARKVDPPDIFYPDCVKTGVGLGASRAIASREGYHYLMTMNDFIVWNGIHHESIGGSVREEVFSRINRLRMNRCFALHVQELDEIWFFIVVSGHDWATEIWKYNYRLGFWYFDTCRETSAATKWQKTTTDSWDDDSQPWDSDVQPWNDASQVQDWEEVILGAVDGYTRKLDYSLADDDGTAIDAVFQSADYTGDQLETMKRWLQLDVWAKGSNGAKLYVDYSTDAGSTWKNIPYLSTQAYITLTDSVAKYRLFFDIRSETLRLRFRNKESGEIFFIRNFYPYYLSREESRR